MDVEDEDEARPEVEGAEELLEVNLGRIMERRSI